MRRSSSTNWFGQTFPLQADAGDFLEEMLAQLGRESYVAPRTGSMPVTAGSNAIRP